MVKLPNEVMLTDERRAELRELFGIVEDTAEFREIARKRWEIDQADRISAPEIEGMIERGIRRNQAWATELRDALRGHLDYITMFGISIEGRKGLEHLPTHVKGRRLTFFVDASTRSVVYVIHSVYSV